MPLNATGKRALAIISTVTVVIAGIAFGYFLGRKHESPAASASAGAAETVRQGVVAEPVKQPFTHFRVGNRNVKSLFVDGAILWVGTSGGLIRYDTGSGQFELFDNQKALLSNGIFHVSRIGNEIFVGTYGGGLSVRNESGKWRNINIPQGLADAFVYDVLRLDDGELWLATWSGANRVARGELDRRDAWSTLTRENTVGGLPNDWVYGLERGTHGEVWLATEGGLARYAGGRWNHWDHSAGLGADFDRVKNDIQFAMDPARFSRHHARQKNEMHLQDVDVSYNANYIVAIAVDRDGAVWAGTWGGGLSRFDGERWQTWTVAEGLPGNHVFALHVDAGGHVWIGTNDGLALRTADGFRILRTEDGLFSNTVFSIASAADGSLWVGSYGGVAHLRHPR